MLTQQQIKTNKMVSDFKQALENDSSIYLSMHGAPAHRCIDESQYQEVSQQTIDNFITDNYCIIPENILYITTTTTNLTLATVSDDEDNFKKIFTTPYWGLEQFSVCKDEKFIPYQIYQAGDVVYNQDLSFDAMKETTFDIYKKKGQNFELYEPTPVKISKIKDSGEPETQLCSIIKADILLRRLPKPLPSTTNATLNSTTSTIHRPLEIVSGLEHKPEAQPSPRISINLRGFFNMISEIDKYNTLRSEGNVLVVYAPYCNPTWVITGSNKRLCLNMLNVRLREQIQDYGLRQMDHLKSKLLQYFQLETRTKQSYQHNLCQFIKNKPLLSSNKDEQDSWLQPEEDSLREYQIAEKEHKTCLANEQQHIGSVYSYIMEYIQTSSPEILQGRLKSVISDNIADRRVLIAMRTEQLQPAYWGGKKKSKKSKKKKPRNKSKKTKRTRKR